MAKTKKAKDPLSFNFGFNKKPKGGKGKGGRRKPKGGGS